MGKISTYYHQEQDIGLWRDIRSDDMAQVPEESLDTASDPEVSSTENAVQPEACRRHCCFNFIPCLYEAESLFGNNNSHKKRNIAVIDGFVSTFKMISKPDSQLPVYYIHTPYSCTHWQFYRCPLEVQLVAAVQLLLRTVCQWPFISSISGNGSPLTIQINSN